METLKTNNKPIDLFQKTQESAAFPSFVDGNSLTCKCQKCRASFTVALWSIWSICKPFSAVVGLVPGPCEPEDLIDGIIFAANYLGCTQVLSDKNPSKSIRMTQAQEAVSHIKVIRFSKRHLGQQIKHLR